MCADYQVTFETWLYVFVLRDIVDTLHRDVRVIQAKIYFYYSKNNFKNRAQRNDAGLFQNLHVALWQ